MFAGVGAFWLLRSIYACLIRGVIEIDASALQVRIERPWLSLAVRRWTCKMTMLFPPERSEPTRPAAKPETLLPE